MSSSVKRGTSSTVDGGSVMCKMSPSQWQPNTLVPTYYVAPKSRKGYFSSLNDAISFAEPYSRIEVLSGKYFENVVIQKPVEIGCEKGDEAADFYSHGVTFTLQDDAYIDGLIIRTGDQKMAMLIENEKPIKPKIVRCEIDSIEVSGYAAPIVSDNRVRNGRVHGIHVTGHASGTYVDNTIESHAWYSVVVESDGEPSFVRNKIQGGERGQVLIRGYGSVAGISPLFTQNRITDELPKANQKTTVITKMDDAPVKTAGDRVNLIPNASGGGYTGRAIMREIESEHQKEDGLAEFDARSAVEVAIGAMPTISNNTIIGSINNGIMYRSGGGGLFEGNFVIANKGWGAVLEDEETNPTFVKNQFSSNGAGGLRVRGAKGNIDGRGGSGRNEFKDNRGPQVMVIHGHKDFSFCENVIQAGARVGLYCRDGGGGVFASNEFNYCTSVAVRIESEANPVFTKNEFKMCSVSVLSCRAGLGTFQNNDFSMNRSACVVVMSLGNPLFENCTFSTSQCAVVVTKSGLGTFRKCQMKDNRGNQIEVSELGNPTFENNTIADGNEDGVRVYDKGRGTFTRNFFCHNMTHMTVRKRGDPVCVENVFTRAVADGIVVEQGGLGLFTDNVIEKSRNDGVLVTTNSYPTIRGNVIANNRHAGLHIGEGGDGVLEKNEIHSSGKANVLVTGNGIPPDPQAEVTFALVKRNWIMNSEGFGGLATSHGSACVVENLFHNNEGSAIRAATSSVLFVIGNSIDGGGEGIAVVEDARCRIHQNTLRHTQGNAIFVDSGAKPFISWNVIDHAATGIALNSGHGFCFENSIKNCTTAGIALGNLNRTQVGFNTLFRNHVGIVLGSKCRTTVINNYLVENVHAGIMVDGEDISAVVEGNTVLNSQSFGVLCRTGASKLSCNAIFGCETNVCIDGPHASTVFVRNLIVGGTVGVAACSKGRGKFEQSIIGHCDRGIVLQTDAQPSFKDIIVHNCSIAGVFADNGGSCEITDSSLFKNFINVVGSRDSKPYVFRSLLQAPTAFNCYFSNGGGGHLYNCVITSLSKHTVDMLDEVAEHVRRDETRIEEEKAVAAAGLNNVAPLPGTAAFEAAKHKDAERHRRALRTLTPLWDDQFSSGGITGHVAGASNVGGRRRGTVAASSAAQSTARRLSGGALSSSGDDEPGTPTDELHLATSRRTSGDYSAASDAGGVSPQDGYLLPPSLSSGGKSPSSEGLEVHGASTNSSWQLHPRNRFAVLYPSNMHTSNAASGVDLAGHGPSAGFQAHRVYHASQGSTGRKAFFEYFCTGVMIDEGANPQIEGCLIKGHDYKPPKKPVKQAVIRQKPRGQSAVVASASLGKLRNGVASSRATPQATSLLPPLLSNAAHLQQATADPDVTSGPFPMSRHTQLHRLLLAASPAFNALADVYATTPLDVLDGYWAATLEQRALPQDMVMMSASFATAAGEGPLTAGRSGKELTAKRGTSASSSTSNQGVTLTVPTQSPATPATAASAATANELGTAGSKVLERPTEAFTGFAIIVANAGEGEIANCIIESNHMGVRVERAGDPKVMRTVIRNQEGDGLVVSAGGLGSILSCHIHNNNLYQISIEGEGTAPLIEGNDIHDSRHIGVHFDHFAAGILRRNRVHDMGNIGVSVAGKADPTIDANDVFACQLNVGVRKSGRGTFQANKIYDAHSHGVIVEGEGASPVFYNNLISENAENGVLVKGEGATPRFEGNELFRNRKCGLETSAKASAMIVGNRVYDNEQHGLLASQSSRGVFTKNIVTGNRGAGFCATSQSHPKVISNVIFDGEAEGILVQNASGHFEYNRVKSNAEHGIAVHYFNANPVITRNEIEGGVKAGLLFASEARGHVVENFVANNAQGGMIVEFSAAPRIERNFFKQNSHAGIWCRHKAAPEIASNIVVLTINGHGIVSESLAVPSLRRNVIGYHSHFGVLFLNEGKGSCNENIITSCGEANVCIERQSTPMLTNNEIFNGKVGVLVRDEGGGIVSNTGIFGKLVSGVQVVGDNTTPTFESCFIHDIRGVGVTDEGRALFTQCHIFGCTVGIESRGNMTFSDSEVRECPTGALCTDGSATFSASVFSTISKIGIQTLPKAAPRCEKLRIFRCRTGMQLEGAGEVIGSDVYWNTDNVIILSGTARLANNNIYDAQHTGVVIKSGTPTLVDNLIFDNEHSSVNIEDGTPLVENNNIYFEQQDGALLARPEMKGALSKNTVRNEKSPVWEKSKMDRTLYYNVATKENDRNAAGFKRLVKSSEQALRAALEAALPLLVALDKVVPTEFRRRPLDEEFTFDDPDDAGSDIIDADWGAGGGSTGGGSDSRLASRESRAGPGFDLDGESSRRASVGIAIAPTSPLKGPARPPAAHATMRTSFKFPTEPAAATGAAAAPSTSRSFSPSQSTTMPRGNSMSASTAAFGRVPSGLGISQIIHDDLSTVAVGARQGRSRGESLFRLPKDVVAALSDSTTLVPPGDVDKVYAKMRRRNREISFMLPDDTAGSDLLSLSKTRSSAQQLQSTASGAALSSPWLSSSPSSPAGGGATASSFLPAIPNNDSLAGGAAGGGGGGRKRAVGFTQALASDDSPPAPVDLNLVEISAAARALIASVDVFTEQTMHPKAAAASADGGGEGGRSKSTVGERSRSNTATVGSKRTTLVPGKPDSDASPASSGLSGSRGGAPRGSRMKSVARVASVLSGGLSTDAESSGSPQTAASPATGGGDGRRKSVAANAMPTLTPTKPNADRRKSRVG